MTLKQSHALMHVPLETTKKLLGKIANLVNCLVKLVKLMQQNAFLVKILLKFYTKINAQINAQTELTNLDRDALIVHKDVVFVVWILSARIVVPDSICTRIDA